MAYKIITLLMKLSSKEGRTVIFTIHQPSHRIFMELDRLMVLDKGECIYQGQAKRIFDYMLSLGITVPAKSTVSDFFMLEISGSKMSAAKPITAFNAETYITSQSHQI
jgi:ABC-type multidrug transport system ATPase subunit